MFLVLPCVFTVPVRSLCFLTFVFGVPLFYFILVFLQLRTADTYGSATVHASCVPVCPLLRLCVSHIPGAEYQLVWWCVMCSSIHDVLPPRLRYYTEAMNQISVLHSAQTQ